MSGLAKLNNFEGLEGLQALSNITAHLGRMERGPNANDKINDYAAM